MPSPETAWAAVTGPGAPRNSAAVSGAPSTLQRICFTPVANTGPEGLVEGSTAVKDTRTSVRFQPLALGVGVVAAVVTGGVVSAAVKDWPGATELRVWPWASMMVTVMRPR